MIDGFFDESGSGKHGITVVSAYFGTTGNMKKLGASWRDSNARNCLPYFHTKDFYKRDHGVFRGLSKRKRKHLLGTLIGDINRYCEYGIAAWVKDAVYKSNTSPRYRSQWGSAYTFCVQMVLLRLAIFLEESNARSNTTVNILLEEGHRNSVESRQHLIRPKYPFKVGTVRLGSKTQDTGLQAADLLAYSSFEHIREPGKSYLYQRLRRTNRPTYVLIRCNEQVIELSKEAISDHFKLRKIFREQQGSQTVAVPEMPELT